jgi:hypothetical protein
MMTTPNGNEWRYSQEGAIERFDPFSRTWRALTKPGRDYDPYDNHADLQPFTRTTSYPRSSR